MLRYTGEKIEAFPDEPASPLRLSRLGLLQRLLYFLGRPVLKICCRQCQLEIPFELIHDIIVKIVAGVLVREHVAVIRDDFVVIV